MLSGKKILLGITGSIAAYKAAMLIRLLRKEGAEVKVIMTPAATTFITPLTISTLSGNPVLTELSENGTWSDHVHLGRWADLMLVAPLSCNTLSGMAQGRCDNLLLAVYLSATCPVVVAPAMDEDMWLHPSTSENINKLKSFGNNIIPVETGELASGLYGEGRMSEPEHIFDWVKRFFLTAQQLNGKKVLITAGPTYEPIDPVRFIGNHSSGKMGIALAESFHRRGADVTLILGPSSVRCSSPFKIIRVQTAAEMYNAALPFFDKTDIAVMAAAVADYTIKNPSDSKIKKSESHFNVELSPTIDILKSLGEKKRTGQILVGFALETDNARTNAIKKLKEKHADYIVLNSLDDEGAGFGYDSNRITIFDKQGSVFEFDLKSKKDVAEDIINTITEKL